MLTVPEPLREPPDFSLVLGGPVYQILRRAHLAGPALELLRRRVLLAATITGLPLLLLSVIGGRLLGGQGLTFLWDYRDAHSVSDRASDSGHRRAGRASANPVIDQAVRGTCRSERRSIRVWLRVYESAS